MTNKEAILTLNANVIIACERAGFDFTTIKMIEDALDTVENAFQAQEPCMDAVSREAVLDLAQTYGPATYDMPYGSGDMIIRPEDVKTLPSVQPISLPRVMTLEEVYNNVEESAWFESHGTFRGKKGFWILLGKTNAGSFTKKMMCATGMTDTELGLSAYGKIWRCWTSRPSDEQREATPWN